MVAVITAGDPLATARLSAYGWPVYEADASIEDVLVTRAQAEKEHRHVVAVLSGDAATLAAALATEGRVEAVVSVGPLADFDEAFVAQVRSPWLALVRDDPEHDTSLLEIAIEKAHVPARVVHYRDHALALDLPDAFARTITWIEHWAG